MGTDGDIEYVIYTYNMHTDQLLEDSRHPRIARFRSLFVQARNGMWYFSSLTFWMPGCQCMPRPPLCWSSPS